MDFCRISAHQQRIDFAWKMPCGLTIENSASAQEMMVHILKFERGRC